MILSGCTLALLALSSFAPRAYADTGAWCQSDPASGPIGTHFVIACGGFDAQTYVYPYYVQPDGAAEAGPVDYADATKTDAAGNVQFVFPTKPDNYFAFGYGKWTIVVEQLGPAKSVVQRGVASFVITGGTEGVAGAQVWAWPDSVHKGETFTLSGSGFAPWEIVSVWAENPRGECSSFSYNTGWGFNDFYLDGVSTFLFQEVKADGGGNLTFAGSMDARDCSGVFRFVARGNASGRGGATWLTLNDYAVTESAYLVANQNPVHAMFGSLSFSGWGYQSGEHVTCWTTDPQGRAVWLDGVYADARGNVSVEWFTGSFAPGVPVVSAGPLGEWALTCRGDSSGRNGIARYTVIGNPVVDP